MTKSKNLPPKLDPKRDLVLERDIDVPRELVWKAWTEPEHLKEWFTPRPWTVSEVEMDVRPGGIFRTVMRSPEGEDFPNVGCFLEVVPNERLVWTDLMQEGFRPLPAPESGAGMFFTCVLTLQAQGKGTRYVATVMHTDEAARKKHEEMGFFEGWGAALDQLVAHAKKM